MTSVVVTKQGKVALGASTIFVVGTAQLTQAATTQLTGTYNAKTLKAMCGEKAAAETVKPEYQILDPSTMDIESK
jgi:hypothetical protein